MHKKHRNKNRQCPQCYGENTHLVDSRPGPDYVYRRYKCDNGHSFTMFEVYAQDLQKIRDKVRDLQDVLKSLPQGEW